MAEGAKQWLISASDHSFLKVNAGGSYSFAGYGVPANKRLYIHLADPENEKVYIGLSKFVEENSNTIRDINTAYQFRIKSPSGSIVHGPHAVSTPNLTSYNMAATGPADIYAGGYPTNNTMWVFDPAGKGLSSGDYYIEFSTAGSIRWFDITVATSGVHPIAKEGRVWSQAWAVRANDGFGDRLYFNEPFNGALVAYDGKYATKIDFQGSGIRPLEGQFSFNTRGTGNTGNKANDRKSVNGANSGNPEHKIFLNLPDPAVYPLQAQGTLENLPLKVTDLTNPTIPIEVTQAGQVELLLDFDGNGVFTSNLDVRLFADVVAGVNQLTWDGKNAQGVAIQPDSYPIATKISYTQGETHFTAYDVEGLDNGFTVFTHTSSSTIGPRLQFWDDSNIPDTPGSAGASDAKVNIDDGATTRRRWNNKSYGDLNTINTWWYAYREAQTTTILLPDFDYGDAPNDGSEFNYGIARHIIADSDGLIIGAKKAEKEDVTEISKWTKEWTNNKKKVDWFKENKKKRKKAKKPKNENKKVKDKDNPEEYVEPRPVVVGDGDEEDGLAVTAYTWENNKSCTGLLPDGTTGTITMTENSYCITAKASNTSNIAGQFVAWIDFNQNGVFDDPAERSVVDVDADPSNDDTQGNVPAGTNNADVVLYWENLDKLSGDLNTFIRMRFTSDPEFKSNHSPDPIGVAINGEVEDTAIGINVVGTDYGDAPTSYGDASHIIELNAYMGTTIDNEVTSQNTANGGTDGTGDDVVDTVNHNYDDDDGVATLPALRTDSSSYSLDVIVTSPTTVDANLVGWIDFDNNGIFDSDEAATVVVPQNTTETTVTLTWSSLPTDMTAGNSYVRLRLTTDTTIATGTATTSVATGLASDGEVEDYALTIEQGLLPFVCNGRPYTVIGNPGILQEMNTATLAVSNMGNFDPAIQFNGIAYNALDNFIYGYALGDGSIPNLHIMRSGANRQLLDLGLPTGSETFNPINFSGTMDNAGNFYGISNANLFIVDIGTNPEPGSLTYTTVPRTGNTSTTADITFSIFDDALYGITGRQLIRISTTGVGSVTATTGDALPSSSGGAWSASDGSLYFYNNGGGELYKVDLSQSPAIVTKVGNVTPNGLFDGTACTPPSLKKNANVSETQAGNTFSYTYTVHNAFNFPITVNFSDVLPATLKYDTASLSNNSPAGGSLSTFDESNLIISNMNLGSRANVSFTVTVKVDASINTEQNIDNQAFLTYGSVTLSSDDPDTGAIDDPTRVHVVPADFGDAPDSYGDAGHGVANSPAVYLGAITPDVDSDTQNTANGSTDGTGDDNDGTDDEDGISRFPKLTDIANTYELSVVVTNTSGSTANLVGWIDFNGDNSFDTDEATTLAVNTGASANTVTLRWNNIPSSIKAGDVYARFRFTTDTNIATGTANTSVATGFANDGEVEDYPITIEIGGFAVKGRVYNDSNVNASNDVAEKGVSSFPVVLMKIEANPTNNTCVSTKTKADGSYTFFPVIPGDYQLYEASRETVPVPNNCGVANAKDPTGYRSTTAQVLAQFSVVDAEITGKDFGNINDPTFSPDQSGTVLAGNVVFYTHTFTPKSTGTVNFSTTSTSPTTSGWSSITYQDSNCNKKLDGTEGSTPIGSNLTTTANTSICLINKVSAPTNVADGETYSNTISAAFDFNGNALAGNTTLKVTDVTKASANDTVVGSSKLELRKTVQNTTQNSAETETQNQAKPRDILTYRVYYSNTGSGVITDLKVNDTVPTFTVLQANSASCDNTPTGLTCVADETANPAIKWRFTGTLQGGAKGSVSYDVQVE